MGNHVLSHLLRTRTLFTCLALLFVPQTHAKWEAGRLH